MRRSRFILSTGRVGEALRESGMPNDFKIEYEDVDNLLLDPENPRLPEDLIGGGQKAILQYIARHEAVEDLMAAIGRNGFFEGEPLVVYKAAGDRGKWRVIEGNRRLASVKLLHDPSLYSARKSLAEISNDSPKRNKPLKLPVVRVPNREAALPYLGSRHIVGVKSWEPLPKARYILQLFELTSPKKPPLERYREVALQIGSGKRTDYIRKNLNALAVFELIKKADFFSDKDGSELSFNFGVLYTALEWGPIAGHVGVVEYDSASNQVVAQNDPIVSPRKLDKAGVAELYEWCFKKQSTGGTVLGESRNLSRLAQVLRSPTALKALRSTKDLDLAFERSEGMSTEVAATLSRVLGELRYANSLIANVVVDDLFIELAEKIVQQAEALFAQAESAAAKKPRSKR
jgi:ParB/Sulfiredoxin domain